MLWISDCHNEIFVMHIYSEASPPSEESNYLCIKQTKSIGPTGGEITLEGGVRLSVPANALVEPTEITFGVSCDPQHRPQVC